MVKVQVHLMVLIIMNKFYDDIRMTMLTMVTAALKKRTAIGSLNR